MLPFLDNKMNEFDIIIPEIYAYLCTSGNPHLWIKIDEIILSEKSILEKINLINAELNKCIIN